MANPEIIDLTESPTQPTNTAAQEQFLKPPSVTQDAAEQDNDKKKLRKRKRKKSGKSGAQSQNATAANTRSNSEVRDDDENEELEEGILQTSRQIRRKQEEDARTKQHDTRSPQMSPIGQQTDASLLPEITANGNANAGDLFFMDISPGVLPSTIGSVPPPTFGVTASSSNSADEQKLLLPAHVSVLGTTPVEILPPTESDEEGDTDYIKYLDYEGDDRRENLRYFQEPEDESVKLKRTVCKKCGAEGDHKSADCRVLICLTCGARDEHVTRSCPVSKVCFSCGMKGHIISNCPNRHMARPRDHGNSNHCDRCYSRHHGTSECPTWWRLYVYVNEEHRSEILAERQSRRDLELGKGGEGFIAEDPWCYNCGEVGHWGDNCQGPARYDKPAEPSAFGLDTVLAGPFHDNEESSRPAQLKRRLRDWEREDEDWSKHAPDNVGRQGKKKMMEKMKKHAQRVEESSDEDDWFHRNKKAGSHSKDKRPASSSRKEESSRPRSRERDRQRDRDWERDLEARDRKRDGDTRRERERERERDRERDRGRDRDRDRDRSWGRENEREREKERRKEGNRDQDRARDRDQNTDRRGESGKIQISISKTIGEGRKFLPPTPNLPARPPSPSRPSLLNRISDTYADDGPSSRNGRSSNTTLSIKGAGKKQQVDGNRDHYSRSRDSNNRGPRYRGGYSR